MRRLLPAITALLAISGWPAFAEDPLEPPDLLRYLRWGPLRVRPTLGVSNLGFDDNVFFSNRDEEKQGDYRITLSPRLEGLLLFGDRAFLVFDEKLDYTLYQEFNDQNFLNQSFTTRITLPLERIGFFVDLGTFRRKDRPNSELDTRLDRQENQVGAGIIVKLGWRTFAEIGRTYSDSSQSDPDISSVGDLLDRVERGNRARVQYRLMGQTRLTLQAAVKKITFDNPDVQRDSRETSLLPGVKFGEGARLSGSVELGVARIDLRDPLKRDFSELVGGGNLAYRLGTDTTLRLEGRREVGYAVFQQNNFFLDRSVSTRVIHFLNRVLGFEVGGQRGKLTFPQAEATGERTDRITQYDLGVRVRLSENALGKRVEYTLRWRRYRRDSNGPFDFLDQNRSTIGMGAVVGF